MSTDNTNSSNDAANSTNGNNANRSKRKNPNSNLNNHYTVLLEGGLIVALVIFIIAMNVNLHSSKNKGPTAKKQNVVKMKKVQQTQQKKKPPPPAAPVVPVKVPNDVTLKNQVSFDVDINNHQDLPAPPKEHHASKGKKSKEKIFVAVGTMPKLKRVMLLSKRKLNILPVAEMQIFRGA
jgi:protein TonB